MPRRKQPDETGGNVLGACEYEAGGTECDRHAVVQINGYALCSYHRKYGEQMTPRPNSAPNPPDEQGVQIGNCEYPKGDGKLCNRKASRAVEGVSLCDAHYDTFLSEMRQAEREDADPAGAPESAEQSPQVDSLGEIIPDPKPPQEYLAIQRKVLAVRISEATFAGDHPNPEHCPGVTYDPETKTAAWPLGDGVEAVARIGDWIVKDGEKIHGLDNETFLTRYILKSVVDDRKRYYSPSQALADAVLFSENLERIIHRLKRGRMVCEKINGVRIALLEELTTDDNPRQERLEV